MEFDWQDCSDLIGRVNNARQVGYIYKFFDGEDHLIYIGKTIDLAIRMKAHKSEDRIWSKVVRIESCEVALADLDAIEGQLIHKFHPVENRRCIADCYRVMREAGQNGHASVRLSDRF